MAMWWERNENRKLLCMTGKECNSGGVCGMGVLCVCACVCVCMCVCVHVWVGKCGHMWESVGKYG